MAISFCYELIYFKQVNKLVFLFLLNAVLNLQLTFVSYQPERKLHWSTILQNIFLKAFNALLRIGNYLSFSGDRLRLKERLRVVVYPATSQRILPRQYTGMEEGVLSIGSFYIMPQANVVRFFFEGRSRSFQADPFHLHHLQY